MLKNLLPILFLFSISVVKAQTFTLSPLTAQINVAATDESQTAKAKITNNATTERTFRWERNIVKMTTGWETAVCDKVACYTPRVNTQSFKLAAGETANLDVYAYPRGLQGNAEIQVKVVDLADSTKSITATYCFNLNCVTSTFETFESVNLKVFPNPTSDIFIIEGEVEKVNRIKIFNQLGQMMANFEQNDKNIYPIYQLEKGIYIIQFEDEKKQVLKSVRLIKQ